MEEVTAFYLAPRDLKTPRTGEPIAVGQTVAIDGAPALCERGLHASRHVLDAAIYRGDGVLTLVRLGGTIVEGTDKACATERTPIAILSQERSDRVMRLIACDCAELALGWAIAAGATIDPRSIDAIVVARRYAVGEATAEELSAAGAAAGAAAWDAAGAAARVAAWTALHDAADRRAREALLPSE